MNKNMLLAASLLLASSVHSEVPRWPQDGSDLKADASLVFGSLDSGLRYVIMPNTEPPGRASLRLYMDVGSLMEADDQQGMAHFLEHMAFNGSKNFKAGSLVEYFQRLGMGFGADTNAHTSFKETVYKLEMPKTEEAMLNDGIKLFRDYLDGLLLGAEEIDRERGIIQSEKLARDSVEWRTQLEGFKFGLPHSKIPQRMPIGVDETLKNMKRPRFADFYNQWYSPERAVLVVVGDVKPDQIVELIKTHFGNLPKGKSVPDPSLGEIKSGRGLTAKLHTEMEAGSVDMSIEIARPFSSKGDSAARRREVTVRALADAVVNTRLEELTKAENPAILGGAAYSYDFLNFVELTGIQVKCNPDKWKDALALAEQEVRRAVQHGFTEAEFEEARANIAKMARLRAEQAPTRKSRDLADQIVDSIGEKKVFTSPIEDLKRVEATLASISRKEIHEAYQAAWNSKDVMIFVGGKLKLDGDAESLIKAEYVSSAKKPVSAPAEEKVANFAYTDFGKAGEVVEKQEVKDLEVTMARFGNNVRLNIKPTPFEKNVVRVMVSFGGGVLDIPGNKPGIGVFAEGFGGGPHGGGSSTFIAGGLEKHSADELRQILASKTVSADFAVGSERMGSDAFLLSGRTTPQDLEVQLQLLAAYLAAPGYREEAERQFRQGLDALYQAVEHTDNGIMMTAVESFTHSGDPRFGLPKRAELEKRNTAELKAWLEKPLKQSYLEIAIVGDVKVDDAIQLTAKTFGALPARDAKKPDYKAERTVVFPSEPKQKDFRFKTEIPRASALVYWPTTDMSNIQKSRRLTLLGAVIDDRLRLKIREELGDSYSPMAHHNPSDTFTGYGQMFAFITLKPEQVAKVGKIVADIGAAIAKDGSISADEFERARKPLLTALEQQRRDNSYWMGRVVRNCQEQPFRLDWARSMMNDITSIKKEDLEALAKEYLGPGKATVIGIIPE
ncbi:MAG: insulinase family protein [Verrucomicrobiaceae bacterium]|nr:insulinase family protein [Verrucomicrobiaceae bacterium]